MAIDLQPGENVFYPMPYIEGEPHLLVITDKRLVHFGDAGKQELAAKEIGFIGRMSGRPHVAAALIVMFLGLASVGLGIYWIVTSGLLSSGKAAVTASDDPSAVQGDADDAEDAPPPEDKTLWKVLGLVCAPLGLILIVVGVLLIRVNRHLVIVRGGQQVVEIKAANQMEQTQILATLGALQSSSKQQAQAQVMMQAAQAAAAPKPKAVEVDDKGDPVKALQDLAAQRAAGKVSQEEFEAKRDVLVQRVRNRR